ncbi:MAG: endonuclease/exonuclease/phosphatase family protein [Planctomycetes bacterium]|nr:endonuclease/exonuclease/phosphatase family protein [Planctomycetota bacterium]
MKLVFWNVNGLNDSDMPLSVARETDADVLVLAEYEGNIGVLCQSLRKTGSAFSSIPMPGCEKISVAYKQGRGNFSPRSASERSSIVYWEQLGNVPILLAFLHLPSKLHRSESDQRHSATLFKNEIESVEKGCGNFNTIILGDFNMNPWEQGMVSTDAFNSLPCLETAKKETREINGERYRFFYNPTWNLLGDFRGSPGTYFHKSPGVESHYWNMLDQVIMRPSIADRLNKETFRVLDRAGDLNLRGSGGRPGISDHLPIYFELDLRQETIHGEPLG